MRGVGKIQPIVALAAACTMVCLVPAFSAHPADVDEQQVARGEVSYRLFCASCHGKAGRGDGPLAEALKTAPTDLTLIALANGGELSNRDVESAIDGRAEIGSHGRRDMPVWGWSFEERGRDSAREGSVEERIRDLVAYIEAIQRRSDESASPD